MKTKRSIRPWAVFLWLLVWQGGSMLLAACCPNGQLLLASPVSALARLFTLALTPSFWRSVTQTGAHIFGGFALSCTSAVLLAALAAGHRPLRELLSPIVAVIQSVPVASFIILALLWLDGRSLPLAIAALMAFPPIYRNTLEGIAQTDTQLLEMAKVFRVPKRNRLRGIYLPQVLPYFRSAVSVAMGLCWKAGIAAEVIGLSSGSIGERLYTAKVYFETPELFAWTAAIVLLSALAERVLLRLLDALAGRVADAWS